MKAKNHADVASTLGAHHQWEEAVVKKAYSHMRIHFRTTPPAVRNLVLQECLADVDPGDNLEGLIRCLESKLE
ncbi:MAG TPA: hypothetical protein VGE29_03955 [Prosthecobacter sp.]